MLVQMRVLNDLDGRTDQVNYSRLVPGLSPIAAGRLENCRCDWYHFHRPAATVAIAHRENRSRDRTCLHLEEGRRVREH